MDNFSGLFQNAALLRGACVIMTPLLFAATGGLYTELAGMLNVALEGLLLAGAFAAVAAVSVTGSLTAGLALAVFVSMTLALLVAFTTLKLRSNVFITGLAANMLAGGLTVVLSHRLFDTRGVIVLHDIEALPIINIPLLVNIPFLGSLLSGYSLYVYAGWLLLLASWIVIYKTPFGYRLRACGKYSVELASLGIESAAYRYASFLISGFFCGIGGAFLSLNLGVFVPNMPAGKGWIALVIIFLGGRRPAGLLLAALAFGLAEAFSNYAQGVWNIPADFILALPFLFTLIAMIAASIFVKRQKQIT